MAHDWLRVMDLDAALHDPRLRQMSQRKLARFAAACVRLAAASVDDPSMRELVEITERYAEGLADGRAMIDACERAQAQVEELAAAQEFEKAYRIIVLRDCARFAHPELRRRTEAEGQALQDLVNDPYFRDIFVQDRLKDQQPWQRLPKQGISYLRDVLDYSCSACFDPTLLTWRDRTVPKLAQAAYDQRELPSGHLDARRLAILADALEEAGCANDDVLAHLRGPGPHVRGCWVVDLLLGRE